MDFEALAQRYRDSLPDKFAGLMGAWENWVSQPDDPAGEREFRGLIHRIAGSAGAFGYAELGQQAKAIDDRMLRWQDDNMMANQPLHQLLEAVREPVVAFFGDFTKAMEAAGH